MVDLFAIAQGSDEDFDSGHDEYTPVSDYTGDDDYDLSLYLDDDDAWAEDGFFDDDEDDIVLMTSIYGELDVIYDGDRVFVVSIENDGTTVTLLDLSENESVILSELLQSISGA